MAGNAKPCDFAASSISAYFSGVAMGMGTPGGTWGEPSFETLVAAAGSIEGRPHAMTTESDNRWPVVPSWCHGRRTSRSARPGIRTRARPPTGLRPARGRPPRRTPAPHRRRGRHRRRGVGRRHRPVAVLGGDGDAGSQVATDPTADPTAEPDHRPGRRVGRGRARPLRRRGRPRGPAWRHGARPDRRRRTATRPTTDHSVALALEFRGAQSWLIMDWDTDPDGERAARRAAPERLPQGDFQDWVAQNVAGQRRQLRGLRRVRRRRLTRRRATAWRSSTSGTRCS